MQPRARLALPFGALAVLSAWLSGCAAPAPPRPPSEAKPAAAAQSKPEEVKPPISGSALPHVSESSVLGPPQDVEAIAVRGPTGSLEVDLSWAISGAGDLAGYNVYRSQPPKGSFARVNRQLLTAPAFRDTTVAAGIRYRYSVTAVDEAGKESAPSVSITVSVPGNGGNSP